MKFFVKLFHIIFPQLPEIDGETAFAIAAYEMLEVQ